MEWGVRPLSRCIAWKIQELDIPVLYLLHGMNGNHHSWLKRDHVRITQYQSDRGPTQHQ